MTRPAVPLSGALHGGSSRPVLLEVRDLAVAFRDRVPAVRGVDLTLRAGETLGLVGPSGSGKTTTALAILGLLPRGSRAEGRVRWRDRDLLGADAVTLQRIRGAEIGLVPQDPSTALHPMKRVDRQVAEAVLAGRPGLSRRAALEQAREALHSMGLSPERHRAYPFEWSGGMRQRALLAIAVVNRPALLIADEPTTALDALTEGRVLALLRAAREETGAALLLISHDLAVIREMTGRVAVMDEGRIVETSCTSCLRLRPRHPRSAELVAAAEPGGRPSIALAPGIREKPVLEVRNLSVRYRLGRSRGEVAAVREVSFDLARGETLALVGESGAGKSSLARALVRLEEAGGGRVLVAGRELTRLRGRALRSARAAIQIVFQEHHASLNPRRRVGASIAEPLRVHRRCGRREAARRVDGLLADVGLPPEFGARFPRALSGGQRQRVAIARALALEPRVLVLDEPVTSLDAVVRRDLLRLLRELQDGTGIAYLLIAHDLRLALRVAHRVAVMHRGRIVEIGPPDSLSADPRHPYTAQLLAARRAPEGAVPTPGRTGAGR